MKKSLKREIVEVLVAAVASVTFILACNFIFNFLFRHLPFMIIFVISIATYSTLIASRGGFINYVMAIAASVACIICAFRIFHDNCFGLSHHPVAFPIFVVGSCTWVFAAFRSLAEVTGGWCDKMIYGQLVTKN